MRDTKYEPFAVGYHWTCGPFTISTVTQGKRTGYVVYQAREVIAEFITWDEVERICKDVPNTVTEATHD